MESNQLAYDADPRIRRLEHTLADGRQLIYFDDADTRLSPERAPDLRELTPRPANAMMRQDALTGEWVSIAAARQSRVFLPPADLDPLAPQSPGNPSEIPSHYDVAVFENKSPSFGPLLTDGTAPHGLDDLDGIGLGRTRTSVGRCEVVCFSPEHEGSFGTQSVSRARTVIEAWAQRTAALSSLPGVEQVFPFENRGEAIGVTLHHPHGQIYSYPYITPRTQRLLASIDRYGPTLFGDILANEQRGERVVLRGEHWTAFVPFAARWPVEVHLLPHRQVPDFAGTSLDERDELAVLYLRLLRGIDALYDSPTPYIAAWHQAPLHRGRDDIRLMLQLTSPRRAVDKLKYLAGSEAAMGAWIGDVSPEQAATSIRAAIERVDAANPAAPGWTASCQENQPVTDQAGASDPGEGTPA
ncbi:galactose-1-phosphate uridylyltransferase [Luethyella okanaganae]|uniref:Galactose-1-phosphate uridylyltransferase n=1 Tax=Luethyella okanaganae TaxID=69372 RepID=A0ABW1VHL6_9MICO